jgi:hypothetical protein
MRWPRRKGGDRMVEELLYKSLSIAESSPAYSYDLLTQDKQERNPMIK